MLKIHRQVGPSTQCSCARETYHSEGRIVEGGQGLAASLVEFHTGGHGLEAQTPVAVTNGVPREQESRRHWCSAVAGPRPMGKDERSVKQRGDWVSRGVNVNDCQY